MSDHDDFDLADVDSAFERLAADIDSRTRARGSERAIRAARSRRLLAVEVSVAAAILVWVLVGALLVPGNRADPPVTTATSAPLPQPRAFDAATFNDASDGWVGGWTEAAPQASTAMTCDTYDGELPNPLESSTTEFRAGARVGATLKIDRFENSDESDASAVGQTWFDLCKGTAFSLPDESWSGGDSVCSGAKLGDQTFYVITVVHETELAVLRLGATGTEELPEPTRKAIVSALLADLRT